MTNKEKLLTIVTVIISIIPLLYAIISSSFIPIVYSYIYSKKQKHGTDI